jgi:hypothetical protein
MEVFHQFKRSRAASAVLLFLVGGLLVAFTLILHVQEIATPVQVGAISTVDWSSASDLQLLLQAIEMMPTVSADSMPRFGTFFSAQHSPGSSEPWPPLPSNFGLPAWNLGDGSGCWPTSR